MAEALQKLIENGGWQDIKDRPTDNSPIIMRDIRGARTCGQPTEWMPLDTPERMAKIIDVLVDGLEEMEYKEAVKALAKANEIAGR